MDNCEHYFDWGYTCEPVVFCKKCDKEIDELGISPSILQKHDVKDGKFVLRTPMVLKKPKSARDLFFDFIRTALCLKN